MSGNNLRKVVEVSYVDLFITSDVLHCVTVHSWLIHLYYYYYFYIRPGSASPGGKPSGPGGPVGPLPTHFAQQVWIFHLKILPFFLFLYDHCFKSGPHNIFLYVCFIF